jgi:putative membrane protein
MQNKVAQLYNPQVFFAAERTLLAWQRSSISFIALGFVIEKFGIFIKYLKIANDISVDSLQASAFIGIFFIGIGSLICLLSAIQYQSFTRTLSKNELPTRYFIFLGPLVSYTIFFSAIGLAIWLVISNSIIV